MNNNFLEGTTEAESTPTNLPDADKAQAGEQGEVDTKSPEYQIKILEKRLQDKDEFINTLKEENQKTREMYASLEERLQNISKIEEVLSSKGQQQDVGTQEKTGLDEDALVGKVIENLNKKQAEEQYQKNFNSVVERLKEEFGEQNIEAKVQEAAAANGFSVEDMKVTARKSPKAFFKLVGLEGGNRPVTPTPMRGSQTAPQEQEEKDFAYYARLMRENPREYWKPEVQREFRKLFTKKENN